MYLEKLKNKLNKLLQWNFFWLFQTIFKGEWLEIEDVREYFWWDDVRYINWKLTAKYNKLFVNVFRQEKDIDLHLFVDINANFFWWEESTNLYVVSNFLSDLFVFSKKNWMNIIWYLPYLKRNKIKVYHLGNNVEKMYMFLKEFLQVCKYVPTDKYVSYTEDFLNLQKKVIKRHVILIVWDFLDIEERIIKILNGLSVKNKVILFQLPYIWTVGKNFVFSSLEKFNVLNSNIKRYKLV